MKGMNEAESVDESAGQCNGGRDESACGKDQADEEYVLGHVVEYLRPLRSSMEAMAPTRWRA